MLPEPLRGKSEAETKFILNQMVSGLEKANKENRSLKQRLEQLEKGQEQEPTRGQKEPEGKDVIPLEERILEDPEGAIEEVVRKRFGSQFDSLAQEVGEAAFATVKADPRLEDFDEYEDDIREMLKQGNLPATKQNILGAYTHVVGMKTLEEREAAKRAQVQGVEQGGAPPPEEDETPEVTGVEREIMIASGFTDEKEWFKYKDTGAIASQIRVPTGQRKEQQNDG